MIQFKKKFGPFAVTEKWYGNRQELSDIFRPVAFLDTRSNTGVPWQFVRRKGKTIDVDLTLSKEELLASFKKGLRQQIRIAEEEGVTTYFHQDIDHFASFFNEFANAKGIAGTSRQRLEEMMPNYTFSFAVKDEQVLAAHGYLTDAEMKIIRCFHSASKRLDDAMMDKNMIGRANKFLHYQDMLHFKELGYEVYDFGGFAESTDKRNLGSVNDFKLAFGGKVVECTNYVSWPYHILLNTARVLGLKKL